MTAWSWASRGSAIPCTLNTAYIRPEQSYPNPDVPAHRYLTFKNSFMLAITAAPVEGSAGAPVSVTETAFAGTSISRPPGTATWTIESRDQITGSRVPKLTSIAGTPWSSSHAEGAVTVATMAVSSGAAVSCATGIQPG